MSKKRGRSAQNALPILAAYMGHSEYKHTIKYLKFIDAQQRLGLVNFIGTHPAPTMRLTTCVEQFFDLYHFRIKGSSQRTIKAYREALALFLPFAAKYYSIKIGSLSIDHLSLQVILSFLDYLQSDRSNAANTRNQRLAVIKSLAKMIRLMYPQKREIADIILAIPQKNHKKRSSLFYMSKKSLPPIKPLTLKNRWALETIPSFICSLTQAPEPVKSQRSILTTSTQLKKP